MHKRASTNGVTNLLEACEAELKRRPLEFSKEAAESFEAMAEQVKDLDLHQGIGHAFTAIWPEGGIYLAVESAHPGSFYDEARKAYGKGDLGLVIGHLGLVLITVGCTAGA